MAVLVSRISGMAVLVSRISGTAALVSGRSGMAGTGCLEYQKCSIGI